jgi:hypothetical protein
VTAAEQCEPLNINVWKVTRFAGGNFVGDLSYDLKRKCHGEQKELHACRTYAAGTVLTFIVQQTLGLDSSREHLKEHHGNQGSHQYSQFILGEHH